MNPFVHLELNTGDVATARQFYQGLFDWKLREVPMGPPSAKQSRAKHQR
jgi:predicted enzyme related to lactoylglutathione lyase